MGRYYLVLLTFFCGLSVANAQSVAKLDPDTEKIFGTWHVEKVRINGEADSSNHYFVDAKLSFDEQGMRFGCYGNRNQNFRLNSTQTPKQLNIELLNFPSGNKRVTMPLPSIYQITGDQLHIVLGVANFDERPESFDWQKNGPPYIHLLAKRESGPIAKKEVSPAEPKEESRFLKTVKDAEKLQGRWQVEMVKINGDTRAGREHNLVDSILTFEGDRLICSYFPGRDKRFSLDTSKTPYHLNIELRQVPDGNKRIEFELPSLFAFEGDKLHLVFGILNLEERPDSLDWKRNGPPFMHVLLAREVTKTAPPSVKIEPKPLTEKLEELGVARLKALTEALVGLEGAVHTGKESFTTLLQIHQEILEVQCELYPGEAHRTRFLTSHLRILKTLEDSAKELVAAGTVPKRVEAQVRATRLKTEMELEKLK